MFTIGGNGYLVFGENTMFGGNPPSNELWRFTPSSVGIVDEGIQGTLLATVQEDGSLMVQTREPLALQGTLELFDATGRLLHFEMVPAGSPLLIRIQQGLGKGLHVVRLRSGTGMRSIKVSIP
jgi:hypothetical protein